MKNGKKSKSILASRSKSIAILLIIATLITICRLGFLQIIKHDEYQKSATSSQWSENVIHATRGTIYDANGTILAQSAKTHSVYLVPERMLNLEFRQDVCKTVAKVLDLDYDKLMELTTLKEGADTTVAHKVIIKKQLEYAESQLVLCGDKNNRNCHACLYHNTFRTQIVNESGETVPKKFNYSSVIGLEEDSKRYYPMGDFASSLIGTLNTDGVGVSGLERYYNNILSGSDGRETSYGTYLDEDNANVYPANDGSNLKLTIDKTCQYALNKKLNEINKQFSAIGSYGILMDVNTGAILAMDAIGYKGGYDLANKNELNEYYSNLLTKATENDDFSYLEKYLTDIEKANNPKNKAVQIKNAVDAKIYEIANVEDFEERVALHSKQLKHYFILEQWNNYCVSETYHPGSVFKVFLSAAALEENVLGDDFSYYCNGSTTVKDRTFRCHSSWHGAQDLRKGLMNSCNPLFIKVGQLLGADKFYKYFEAFGFTEKTGIESYEEGSSIYFKAEDLTDVRLASSSFGQTFTVTPIQVITALSAIANGGYLMQPYLVDEELDSEGNIIKKTTPVVRRQVISEETSKTVASMMEDVCKKGTGRNGYVSGFRIAGKTGTTQKFQEKGVYIASFACFAPADDPQVALLIIVDEPKGEINGSTICAPAAAKVMETVLEYLDVERQYTKEELEKLDTQTPGVVGKNADEAAKQLKKAGFTVRTVGHGDTIVSQSPAGGQTIPQGGVIAIYTTDKEDDKLTVKVPDLSGMSISAVKKYAASEGLNVRISGIRESGVVSYDQNIEIGAEVEYGTIVTVYFKSYENVGDATLN